MNNTDKLTEAFHLIYDVKDSHPAGSSTAVAAYDALQSIKSMLPAAAVPKRRDGDGRETPALVLDEADLVEVLAALEIAAQVTKTVGDHVMSAHYSGLIAKFSDRT